MKVMIATTPNRDYATTFPPVGALSVINYARQNAGPDFEYDFFNIDALRPSREEAIRRIVDFRPDVLGISAVVSTAYKFVKELTADVRAALPDTLIVVGGNLASAAELLLKRTATDICVPGEGEKVFTNILLRLRSTRDLSQFHDIPGMVLLDSQRRLVNTGDEEQLPPEEAWNYDWADIERAGLIDHYIHPVFNEKGEACWPYLRDPRTYQPHRAGKRLAVLNCVKGCVARCTFCHRNQKGIRHLPVATVMERLDHIMERYNVGFLYMGAETFGADKRWLGEFLDEIAKRDVIWGAGGVRANTLTPDWIRRMKEAGCVNLSYGNETGSERMLAIMEKKVSAEQNYQAMRNAIEAGFPTGMQFVLGMPGETEETVRETIDYIKFGTTLSPELNPDMFAVGYAQALPGTPLYEYARHHGYIKPGLDGEEQYLLSMSNRDACDPEVAINFTDTPRLRWLAWRQFISIEVYFNYYNKYGAEHYFRTIARDIRYIGGYHSGTASIASRILGPHLEAMKQGRPLPLAVLPRLLRSDKPGLAMTFYPALFYRLRHFVTLIAFARTIRTDGKAKAFSLLVDWMWKRITDPWRKKVFKYEYKSLRKIVEDLGPVPGEPDGMLPLRQGR
ncbi:B12-binding domain-containing radical SAM protein [Magnetospirillum sp. UT-4]|uniref:B12-binding domain-containing radical SAM protein n=1 Tax=Magnetospirillum sp. UT-4 TaxID=2681467 RepID=UPI00137F94DC|nr:radical SAM protein [Magnetospirillum sp. UT-4]CAA7621733.1 Fe-S oxidoreductase [Magnetospirillum sp. UT-4]